MTSRIFAWIGAVAVACASCAPTDVVVAELAAPGGDGGLGPSGPPCATNADCAPDDLCERPTCAAPLGRCRKRPVFCDALADPRCGCNRVTYWNPCMRALAGVPSDTPGECGAPAACGGPARLACPDPVARCARLASSPERCEIDPVGTCWVLAPACPPPTPGGVTWEPCAKGPPGPGPGVRCVETCAAIRSEQPHSRRPFPTCP